MTVELSEGPIAPQMRPVGPLIPASELETWHSAAQALAAAERHRQRVRNWARAVYQRAWARGHMEGSNAG
ncbi:MAG: HrpE/YscL family type III secretion apparatus protein, partial [Mesorhizobium sp.]